MLFGLSKEKASADWACIREGLTELGLCQLDRGSKLGPRKAWEEC